MKTIAAILSHAAPLEPGFHFKIENQPYMALVIEDIQELGPHGLPVISVAHYGEQNGDLMRDRGDSPTSTVFEFPTGSLEDPLYLGLRQHRVRGKEYLTFVDEFVSAVQQLYPKCCIQWEDFANLNAVPILAQPYLRVAARACLSARRPRERFS